MFGCGEIQNLEALFRCERYSDNRHNATNILNFLKPELSLLRVDRDIEFAQSCEDFAIIREESGRIPSVDMDVVDVQLADVVDLVREHCVRHAALEVRS